MRKVRILVNKRSGFLWSFREIQKAFDRYWDTPENDLSYQFCRDPADGRDKALRAVDQGFDVLLVLGGDGTINTAGAALMGSDTVLGTIPMGSGNGFARHFGIPLKPEDAVRSLADGKSRKIDVGIANDVPFLVTCSMAWDAAIVRSFERSPVRGIAPYVFAGVYEFFEYEPQPITAKTETGEVLEFSAPMVFTVANLTQFGGGAVIAPDAKPDDGLLELVVARHQDVPTLIANIDKLIKGAVDKVPNIVYRKFNSLDISRDHRAQIQIDGDLIDAPERFTVSVAPESLNILIPAENNTL